MLIICTGQDVEIAVQQYLRILFWFVAVSSRGCPRRSRRKSDVVLTWIGYLSKDVSGVLAVWDIFSIWVNNIALSFQVIGKKVLMNLFT